MVSYVIKSSCKDCGQWSDSALWAVHVDSRREYTCQGEIQASRVMAVCSLLIRL